jgi:hypothetical protein
LFFLIASTALSNLNNGKDLKKTGNGNGGLFFRDLDYKGKMLEEFY